MWASLWYMLHSIASHVAELQLGGRYAPGSSATRSRTKHAMLRCRQSRQGCQQKQEASVAAMAAALTRFEIAEQL